MSEIVSLHAREILDSRGNPTLEAEIRYQSGAAGRAAVPSGASTGSREAVELRDGDADRYDGKGVKQAVANVNEVITPALLGQNGLNQQAIDQTMIELDGTTNKGRLGANALLAVSLAAARARAAHNQQHLWESLLTDGNASLPVPMMNIINGGAHADNSVDMQEFMILPVGLPSFSEALRCGVEIFHALKSVLKKQGMNTAVGDEGGFAPNLPSNVAALDIILEAVELAGYSAGKEVYLGLDVASSEFYRDGKYHLDSEGRSFDAQGFSDYMSDWVRQYPIISIEDGMDEGDWDGWKIHSDALNNKIQRVGDDLFVTNTQILQQ
ncbi:MAG: phosphopyruvate hydratase, partial [Xanthomonadales bacterium]|nr:phosphopyruvate hydratase [Xanthomonadales bacterium]